MINGLALALTETKREKKNEAKHMVPVFRRNTLRFFSIITICVRVFLLSGVFVFTNTVEE